MHELLGGTLKSYKRAIVLFAPFGGFPLGMIFISGAIIRDGNRKRGVHPTLCVVPKKSIFRKNCANPYVINPRGYAQICVETCVCLMT